MLRSSENPFAVGGRLARGSVLGPRLDLTQGTWRCRIIRSPRQSISTERFNEPGEKCFGRCPFFNDVGHDARGQLKEDRRVACKLEKTCGAIVGWTV